MKQMFAYHDKKADAMLDPWPAVNAAVAIRDTEVRLANDENMKRFAEDFTLMIVGEWDPQDGLTELPRTAVIEVKSLLGE